MTENKYVTRASIRESLYVCQTGFNAWLAMSNDGELRPRKLRHAGKALWAYDLDKVVRFLTRYTFKFDHDAEQRLRATAFTLHA